MAKPAPITCYDPLPYKTGITAIIVYYAQGNIISRTKGNNATQMSTRLSLKKQGLLVAEVVSGAHTEKHKIIVY
jgi:hypothetical protein